MESLVLLRKAGFKQLHSQPSLTTESVGKLKINLKEWKTSQGNECPRNFIKISRGYQCPFYRKQTWTQSSCYFPRNLNGREPWEIQTDYIYSFTYINPGVILAATHWEITALSSKLKDHLSIRGKSFWEPPLCDTAMCTNQGAGFLWPFFSLFCLLGFLPSNCTYREDLSFAFWKGFPSCLQITIQ